MEPKRFRNSLEGAVASLLALGDPAARTRARAAALRDVVGEFTVDTVCPTDTGLWETGVLPSGGAWVIVEQYPDRDSAAEGHARWCRALAENPSLALVDINLWNF